jgi:hypothetical protein
VGSPSISPQNTQSDVIDSYYRYVRSRIIAINNGRIFKGVVDANDWPRKDAVLNSYYLLMPLNKAGGGTPTSRAYTFQIEWVWMVQGPDIAEGTQGPNRSKYRLNEGMRTEIANGHYPQYCEKLEWSLDANNNLVGVPFYPAESIWWSAPSFRNKTDKTTGILFGSATVMLTSFSPAILQ